MFCPNCGAHVEDDARFCPTCGTSLARTARPEGTPADAQAPAPQTPDQQPQASAPQTQGVPTAADIVAGRAPEEPVPADATVAYARPAAASAPQASAYEPAPAPAPQPAPAPAKKGPSALVVVIVVAAVLAAVAAATYFMGLWGGTEVPDVMGCTQARAEQLLERAGFDVEVQTVESDEGAAGTVISQDPAAGTRTTAGTVTIIVVEDTGSDLIDIPDTTDDSSSSTGEATSETAGDPLDRALPELADLLDMDGEQIDATLASAGFRQAWGSSSARSIVYAASAPDGDSYEYVILGNGYPSNDLAMPGMDDDEIVTPSDTDSYSAIYAHWTDTSLAADEDAMRTLMSKIGLSGEEYSSQDSEGGYLVWIGTMGERTWTLGIDTSDGWVSFGMAPTSTFEERWGSDFGTFSDQDVLHDVTGYALGYQDSTED